VHDIQNPGNRFKLERTVTLKESNTMSAQAIELYSRLVDPHRTIASESRMMVSGGSTHNRRTRRLGQARLEPHLPVRNDHENDQEHQQNINQRNYVSHRQ